MPTGKYSFYLHADDRTDRLVAMTLEGISKPYRGEFLRTVVTAGAVLSAIDPRLPGLLTEVFDGDFRPGQLVCLVAALSGHYDAVAIPDNDGNGAGNGAADVILTEPAERRRFTVQLTDAEPTGIAVTMLESATTRLRGQLLRSFITAGCALHTLDGRFPRLLATLPVPPATYGELLHLQQQLTGVAPGAVRGGEVSAPVRVERDAEAEHVVSKPIVANMKKLLEG